MTRKNTTTIKIDDNDFDYSRTGKILGLNITSNGLQKQVKIRKEIARSNLNKLYRFRNLSPQTKLQLYKSLVLSALIYPVIPLNTISNRSMLQLQTIQNQGLKFVTNTRWYDFKTAQSLHEECNIDPINIIIYKQARNLWDRIETQTPDLYRKVERLVPLTQHFTLDFLAPD